MIRQILTYSLFLLCLGAGSRAMAQVNAPNLICITNDTLVWELPNNTCGPFNSYDIFVSNDFTGPYTLLASVANAGQSAFYHANAAGVRYYYMQSNHNCPGQPILQSDTLDSLNPLSGMLQNVTVTEGGESVQINWTASPSPEVFAYIISRNTLSGTTIIDTVFTGLTYTDFDSSPDEGPETYFVVAVDRCGNTSLVTPPHNTIFLQEDGVSSCDQTISLQWNAYQNWGNPIDRHEVWVSIDGAAPIMAGTAPGTATGFTYTNADDDTQYCFTIRAIEATSNAFSNSNTICVLTDIVQAVRNLALTNVTVTPSGEVEVDWTWNTNAEIAVATVVSNIAGAPSGGLLPVPITVPLSQDNTAVDPDAPINEAPVTYRVLAVDVCIAETLSNALNTVFLSGQNPESGQNLLNWTPYANDFATTLRYELYRSDSGMPPLLVGTTDSAALAYTDKINVANPAEISACYHIVAVADLTLPDGRDIQVRSRSNTVCIEQSLAVYIPNAFAPNGTNHIFKPLLPFGTAQAYQMQIYDRWGGGVYESQDINQGWDGRQDGRDMPSGPYLYVIRITQADGRVIEQTGDVMLMR